MYGLSDQLGDGSRQQLGGYSPALPGPVCRVGTGERYSDMQIRMPSLKVLELLAKDDVRLGSGTDDEIDIARLGTIRQIPDFGHQRSNPHAPGDQDETVGLGACKREPTGGG